MTPDERPPNDVIENDEELDKYLEDLSRARADRLIKAKNRSR